MTTLSPAASPLTPRHHLWRVNVLVSTYIAYAGYYLTRKAFSISRTSIADEFAWGLDATAHIWTTFLVAYMIGQFVSSFLGRKWGPRVILLGGLGLSIIFNAVFGFANSFPTFIVFMAFNGLVQASGWPGVVGAISEWLRPNERGSIMGIWMTSYAVGNMVVKGVGGYLLGVYGWRWSFWGLTLLTVAVWLILYLLQRDRPRDVGLAPIVAPDAQSQTVKASQAEHVGLREYLHILTHPVILAMGIAYFCIKFLRYALDSWLPAFLNIQGLDVTQASWYSGIFDGAGLAGVVVAGFVLDRLFKGNWALLCFVLSLGMIGGYVAVISFGGVGPIALAWCFGIVGFMLYGPDSLLSGAAAVQVAGERNGVAVAGVVNGIGSFGPVIQEEVIGWLVKDDVLAGMHNTNLLALAMSILFAFLMLVLMWRLRQTHRQNGLEAMAVK
jgi:sugar phosphate permease